VLRISDIGVSSQHFDRIVKRIDKALQRLTTFCDLSGLTKSFDDTLVPVDAHIQVGLESVL